MSGSSNEWSRQSAIQETWPFAVGLERQQTMLVCARISASLQTALRRFREITGHTAVTTVVSPDRAQAQAEPLAPPVHPRCAERLATVEDASCELHWQSHIRDSLRSGRVHSHVCPHGLHCSCVPIYLGGSLVGMAKLVLDGGTPAAAVSAATATLVLTVTMACHESYVSVLRDRLEVLQRHVGGRREAVADADARGAAATRVRTRGGNASAAVTGSVVERALDYLHRHFWRSDPTSGQPPHPWAAARTI